MSAANNAVFSRARGISKGGEKKFLRIVGVCNVHCESFNMRRLLWI